VQVGHTPRYAALTRGSAARSAALPVSVISSIYGMNVIVFNQTSLEALAMALGAMTLLTLAMLRWAQRPA